MNIVEITEKFQTELDVIKHFEAIRWKGKITCPFCSSNDIGIRNIDHRWHCKPCQRSFSVTTKTKIHNTRLPLKTWLFAFSIITDAKKGISAMQLHRNLDISYPTAYNMYMKIRSMMKEETDKLEGIVEMDAAYIGGKPRKGAHIKNKWDLTYEKRIRIETFQDDQDEERKKIDKQLKKVKDLEFEHKTYKKPLLDELPKSGAGSKKIPVMGIVERSGDVVAEVMKTITAKEIKKMVRKNVVEEDSVLITDADQANKRLSEIIDHVMVNHQKIYSHRGVNTNTIESFWAIIKRGIIGQYHSVSPEKLPHYITEFVFKYNNRNEDDMFVTLVANSMKPAKAS